MIGAFKPHHADAKCPACGAKNSGEAKKCKSCGWIIGKLSEKEALELEDAKGKAKGTAEKNLYDIVKRLKAAHGWIY